MLDRTQFYRFEDFITDTAYARSGDELFALLQKAVGQYGYDRLIFSVPFDRDLPPELNKSGLYTTYPDDWTREYIEKDYARLDPVLRAGGTHAYAFTWQELEDSDSISDSQIRFMRTAAEAGLHSGIGVPIRGERALVAGVGLASSEPQDGAAAHLDLINALCNQFYVAFKRLHGHRLPPKPEVGYLSPREREILSWIAAGKTDDDTATIMGISRNTVDTHIRSIFRKLDAGNRVTAVVKGIMQGHIQP
ncbi:LuxR family transcriptional regulator [Asticcacaulis sp. EMRT-3]|uniref:LuxR family transcriptional regulator n=1 Tax=Asticcacaulis sp. EMRT-3 TaxID=3040349 RepID=UPI0024AF2879|nr:LuxR family transcriptional regulator [Asticcacaulis sp. EMRT-3]MDI7775071.1 LuxR family transcriptional regulator [Asticcacaulis sp. EMRT-3]